jgi:hypothetical protein
MLALIRKITDAVENFALAVAIVVVVLGAFAIIYGLIVMSLWNWLMPVLFQLPEIDFLQALGLSVLMSMIFGTGAARAVK